MIERLIVAFALLMLTACASSGNNPSDPWEGWNRGMYKFNTTLDTAISKPLAKGYQAITPDLVETGVSNMFSNLQDVTNMINNLLQGQVKDSANDLARFVINSTIGIAGIWDPASKFGLDKHDEDFGQTLGAWGVESGPYVMLPLLGPSTLRDTLGYPVNSATDPIGQISHIPTRNQVKFVELIDKRAGLLPYEETLKNASDEYAFVRDVYLQNRRYKVFNGDLPIEDDFECEEDEDGEEECDF